MIVICKKYKTFDIGNSKNALEYALSYRDVVALDSSYTHSVKGNFERAILETYDKNGDIVSSLEFII